MPGSLICGHHDRDHGSGRDPFGVRDATSSILFVLLASVGGTRDVRDDFRFPTVSSSRIRDRPSDDYRDSTHRSPDSAGAPRILWTATPCPLPPRPLPTQGLNASMVPPWNVSLTIGCCPGTLSCTLNIPATLLNTAHREFDSADCARILSK